MIGVIYNWKKYNKINGTVYYCIEYYLQLLEKASCNFYVINLSDNDLNLLRKSLNDKYHSDYYNKINIIRIKRTEVFSLNLDKILVLDNETYQHIKFFHHNIITFQDESYAHENIKNHKFFGTFPNYQSFDNYAILKLGCKYHKKFKNGSSIFASGHNLIQNNILLNDENVIYKDRNTSYSNLFNNIYKIIYIHTKLDTNNRIIIEAYYHKKEIEIINKVEIEDSINIRYVEGSVNLQKYLLSNDDEMIKEMLKE